MKLYESIDTLDKIYLVVEYLEGLSLANFLQQSAEKKFPLEKTLIIFKQLMLAVELLEKMSITHRDIKLENIIYNQNTN